MSRVRSEILAQSPDTTSAGDGCEADTCICTRSARARHYACARRRHATVPVATRRHPIGVSAPADRAEVSRTCSIYRGAHASHRADSAGPRGGDDDTTASLVRELWEGSAGDAATYAWRPRANKSTHCRKLRRIRPVHACLLDRAPCRGVRRSSTAHVSA